MWAATLRSYSPQLLQPWKLGFSTFNHSLSSISKHMGLLELQEVEKILSDVRADNVKVIPANKQHDWADFMVIATGRSTWHVRNIAQALIYQAGLFVVVKQKQKGARRLVLPSVEGQEGGKWIVIDSGKVIIHALDENAREYYNLEDLWTSETSEQEPMDLENVMVKVRRINNSKRPPPKDA
ncbi:hypothetical protein F8388_023208 [Cannabis sativa]|uniref:Protein Iojap-related, mitochondrial n=1 Tax=Cannabis sativa TaxID=3483 RepID=A0A7J6HDQ5_CANSA|nr:hypothetical protein F8388_023208 [Cannabis sativa]KAF4396636.1 hypothetical protein G4B88_028950 [Cannabis sativa]